MANVDDVLNGLSEEQRARLRELTGLSFPVPVPVSAPVSSSAQTVPDLSAFQKPAPPIDRNELNGRSAGNIDADVPTDLRVPLLKEAQTAPVVPRERVIGLPPPGFRTGISIGDYQFPSATDTTLGLAQSLQPVVNEQQQNAQTELPPVPRPQSSASIVQQPQQQQTLVPQRQTPEMGILAAARARAAARRGVPQRQTPEMGILNDYSDAAQREKEAISSQALATAQLETAKSALVDAEIKRQKQREEEQRLMNERRQFDQNVALSKLEEAQQAYEKADINPGQWWDSRSDGQKFAAVVGALLGGLGSGLSRGPNSALDIINNHISNDIMAQRAKLSKMGDVVSKRRSALQDLRDQFNDEDAAVLALENIKLQGVKLELDKQMADTTSQLKIAQGAEMVAKIDKQMAENTVKLASIIDENSRANFLADLQAQKLVAEQSTRQPQALTETAAVIMDTFRGDTKRQNAALKELGQRDGYNKETQVILNAARKLKDIKARFGELIPGTNPSREWDQQVSIITSTLQRGIKGAASDKDIERMMGLIPKKLSTDSAVDASIEALLTERQKGVPQTPLLTNFIDGRMQSVSNAGSSSGSSNDETGMQSPQKKSEAIEGLGASNPSVVEKLQSRIPENNRELIKQSISEAAQASGAPEDLLLAIAFNESKFNPLAKNPKSSASGMFQQIDSTAENLGVKDRFDVKQASAGAGKHLAQLLQQFEGDKELAAKAYYGGPEIVRNALQAGRRDILVSDVPLNAPTNNPGPDGRITFRERVERAKNMNEYGKKILGLLGE